MRERMSECVSRMCFQMICQKLCQNNLSGRGSPGVRNCLNEAEEFQIQADERPSLVSFN